MKTDKDIMIAELKEKNKQLEFDVKKLNEIIIRYPSVISLILENIDSKSPRYACGLSRSYQRIIHRLRRVGVLTYGKDAEHIQPLTKKLASIKSANKGGEL